jgi:hypothetical protein
MPFPLTENRAAFYMFFPQMVCQKGGVDLDGTEAAFRKVDENEAYIVDVLRRVIAVDTTVPPGENYDQLIDTVEPEFKKFGFHTERVVMPEEKIRGCHHRN